MKCGSIKLKKIERLHPPLEGFFLKFNLDELTRDKPSRVSIGGCFAITNERCLLCFPSLLG